MLISFPFVLSLLLPMISAADIFIGCHIRPPSGGTYNYALTGSPPNAAACAALCSARPEALPGALSVYKQDTRFCRCLNSDPGPGDYWPSGNSNLGSDVCDQRNFYSVYRLLTTFAFDGCYQYVAAGFKTQSLNECFNTCKGERGVFVSPRLYPNDEMDATFDCQCGSADTIPGALDGPRSCYPYGDDQGYDQISYFYSHPAGAAASQLVRRKRHIPAQPQFCPAGTTACMVQGGDSDSYECIDTMTELESCGGCVFGEYKPSRHGKHNASSTGINCSDDQDNMTCKAGRCVRAF